MKISKSKVTLAAKIKSSGFEWPQFGKWATQDKDGEVFISGGEFTPVRRSGEVNWCFDVPYKSAGKVEFGVGWFQCIISRAEYFHLYPAPDADGWIEWNGGECPVQLGTLVDVKYTNGITNIGVSALTTKAHEGHVSGSAGSLLATNWSYGLPMSGIIAYRLHKPERENPESCEPVMSALIGVDMASGSDSTALFTVNAKPTIEQLAADYRNAKDYAERKQQEADAAKADAEVKLADLVAAGKALGLVVSVATTEPGLVITVKVGDEVECVKPNVKPSKYKVMVGTVLEVDDSSTPYLVDFGGEERIWCHEVKFIRRP